MAIGEYELLWQNRPIGRVTDSSYATPWTTGAFQPTALSEDLRRFFNFMADESNSDREPPFPVELLEEENWSMRCADGSRRGISVPAVHLTDSTIEWRWRSGAG